MHTKDEFSWVVVFFGGVVVSAAWHYGPVVYAALTSWASHLASALAVLR